MAIRRKALRAHTFANGGPHVPAGHTACVSAWDILHDETKYPYAETFDGFRFVKPKIKTGLDAQENKMLGTKFTDASKDFPIW